VWHGRGRRTVLSGIITFIGCAGPVAKSRYWGDQCVGKKRVLVKVTDVFCPNLKPTFVFKDVTRPERDWATDSTYGSLFNEVKDLVMMVPSYHLNLIVSSESEQVATHICSFTSGMLNIGIASADSDAEPLLQQTVPNSNDDKNEIRSRDKADIFHQINKVPLKRGSSAAPYICALLIAAKFDFDNEDFKHFCAYLSVKVITTRTSGGNTYT
jgi:hypothetical protein